MGQGASRPHGGPCCGGRPGTSGEGTEREEEGEFVEPRDLEKLIQENRAEVDRAMEQIGRKKSEVQESSRQLDVKRLEVEEAFRKIHSEREEIAVEWSRLEASRGELQAEREEVRRFQERLQAGQESLQVEREEVSRLRAEFQASQKNSWWFTCSTPGADKKHACAEAKQLPHDASPTQGPPFGTYTSQDCNPRRLSFETQLPGSLARGRGGG